MEKDIKLKLDVNLQQYSNIVIVTRLWNSPVILKKIEKLFNKYSDYYEYCYYSESSKRERFKELYELVYKRLKKLQFPTIIEAEVKKTICLIGEKIFSWTEYILEGLKLEFKFAENICWTCYGNIDEHRTFQLHWTEFMEMTYNPLIEEDGLMRFFENFFGFANSCDFMSVCAQTEFMKTHLKTIRYSTIRFFKGIMFIPNNMNLHSLMKLWICHAFTNTKEEACQTYKNLKYKNNNPDAKVLSMCATAGQHLAVRYFADNITKGKYKHFFWTAEEVLGKLDEQLKKKSKRREPYIEIFILLLNGMSAARRYSILTKFLPALFELFIDVWPYEVIALQMFQQAFPNLSEENFEKILRKVLKILEHSTAEDENLIAANICRKVLSKLLTVIPKELKMKTVTALNNLICKYVKSNDIAGLRLILSKKGVTERWEKIIDDNLSSFVALVQNGEYEVLNKIMEIMSLRDEDRKKFKLKFNMLQDFVRKRDFEKTDELLDWLCDSHDERTALKKQVNSSEICISNFEQKQFDLEEADELLKWQFDSDEEQIMEVKKIIRLNKLVCIEFCKEWGKNCSISVEIAKTKCTKVLKWFFKPDEIETFKKTGLIQNKSLFVRIFCNFLNLPENFKTINELFNFCNIPIERVNETKQEIKDNIDHWIQVFCFKTSNFRILHYIVDWIAEDDENKKKEIIGNYLNADSEKGILLCKKVYDNCMGYNNYVYDSLFILFHYWIKPYGDIPKLLKDVIKYYFGRGTTEFKDLLQQLQKNGCIGIGDIDYKCNHLL